MTDSPAAQVADKARDVTPWLAPYLIIALYLLIGISMSSILFTAPLKALDLGASEVMLGSLVSALVSTGLIFSFAGAALCDRIGERTLVAVAFGSYVSAQVIGALADSPGWLLLSAVTAGVGDMLFTIGAMTYLTETARTAGKDMLISASFSLMRLGSVLGSALAGQLAEAFGYPKVFFSGMVISATGILVSLILPRREQCSPRVPDEPTGSLDSYRSGYRLLRDNPMVRVVGILTGLSTVGWFTFKSSFYLNHLRRVGMTKGTMGLVVAAGSAAAVVAPFVYAWLTRRARRLAIILAGAICAGLGLAATPMLSSPVTLSLVAIVAQMGDTFRQPGVYSLLGIHTKPEDRPVGVAIVNTSWAVAALCAGPALGLLARVAGLSAPFLVAGFGTVATAIALWILYRRRRRATATT
jgi:MFS family permease